MLVLFNTRHYTNYQTYTGTYKPVPTGYTYLSPGGYIYADYSDPYVYTAGLCYYCTRRSVTSLIASNLLNIQTWCEDTAYTDITTYASNYANYMYTWTTCDFYMYDFNSLDCSLNDVYFTSCSP